jgi:hypothetical protein
MNWQSGMLRRAAVAAGGALVVGGVVVLVVTTTTPGTSGAQSGTRPRAASHSKTATGPSVTTGSSTTTPAAPSTPATPPPSSAQPQGHGPVPTPVAKVFHGFRSVSAHSLQTGKLDRDALGRVTQGFVKGAITAHAEEFAKNGWHQEGRPRVVWTRTVDSNLDKQPPTVTIEACIDSSDVRILGENGKPVLGTTDKPPRVPNLYTLVKAHGTWKVSGHSFPREPTC